MKTALLPFWVCAFGALFSTCVEPATAQTANVLVTPAGVTQNYSVTDVGAITGCTNTGGTCADPALPALSNITINSAGNYVVGLCLTTDITCLGSPSLNSLSCAVAAAPVAGPTLTTLYAYAAAPLSVTVSPAAGTLPYTVNVAGWASPLTGCTQAASCTDTSFPPETDITITTAGAEVITAISSSTTDIYCRKPGPSYQKCWRNGKTAGAVTITVFAGNPTITLANGGAGTSGWTFSTAMSGVNTALNACTHATAPCLQTAPNYDLAMKLACNTVTDVATVISDTAEASCAAGTCTYTPYSLTTTLTASCAPGTPTISVANGGAGTSGWVVTDLFNLALDGCTQATAPCTQNPAVNGTTTLACNTATDTATLTSDTADAVCAGASCTYTPTALTTTLTAKCAAAAAAPPAPSGGGGGGGGGGGLDNQPPYFPGGGPWLISPEDKANGNGDTPFVWKILTDLDGDTVTYYLYACSGADFADCKVIDMVVGNGDQNHRHAYGLGASGVALLLIGFGYTHGGRRRLLVAIAALALTGSGALIACGAGGGSGNDGVLVSACADAAADSVCREKFNLAPGDYQWKVSGEDGRGGLIESEARNFTVK